MLSDSLMDIISRNVVVWKVINFDSLILIIMFVTLCHMSKFQNRMDPPCPNIQHERV
jgi:hypothetical protein